MAELLILSGMTALLAAGFALLALSQDQRRRAAGLPPIAPRRRAAYRATGYALLVLALPMAIRNYGPGFGTLLWGMLLSIAAYFVTFAFSWKSHCC